MTSEQIAISLLKALHKEKEREPELFKRQPMRVIRGELMQRHSVTQEDMDRGLRFLLARRFIQAWNHDEVKYGESTVEGENWLASIKPLEKSDTKKKRVAIPPRLSKKVYQEAGSKCSFCDENDTDVLDIHHIDEDPSNNAMQNLFLACAVCHRKITAGTITLQRVKARKLELTNGKSPSDGTITWAKAVPFGKPLGSSL
jgi:hypothetical protein